MKATFFQIAFAAIFVFAANMGTAAQAPAKPDTAPVKQNEIMTENDRLPFMQTEDSVETTEPSSGGMLLKTFGSMLVVVGLLFFGAWGVKKFGLFGVKSGDADSIAELAISSSVSVANGQTISVVRFGDRVLLVGSTPQSFTLLSEEFNVDTPSANIERRSVSELLAEESLDFEYELKSAQKRLSIWNDNGGSRS